MISNIRSFASFCIFFLGSSIVFWPLMLVLLGFALVLPLVVYWQFDAIMNLEMLIAGVNLPEEDWLLIFLVPSFILGLPAILSHYGGELVQPQIELYSYLLQSISTPYGLVGWFLTFGLVSAFLYGIIWSVQKTMNLSAAQTSNYFALLALILGGAVFYI